MASGARSAHELLFDSPAFARARGASWISGAAASLDPAARTVTLEGGERLEYDRCVIAIGSVSDAPPHLLASARVSTAKWVSDAIAVRETLHAVRAERTDFVRVIVAGCALTAVEWGAELASARIDGLRIEVSIVGASPRLLREFHPSVGRRAATVLQSLGVRLRFASSINAFADGIARTTHGEECAGDLLLWAGGVRPNPALAHFHVPLADDGRVLVTPRLNVVGQEGLYAIGDAAQIMESGMSWPSMLRAIEAIWQGTTLGQRFAEGAANGAGPAHQLRRDFWYGLSLGSAHSAVYRGSWIAEHRTLVAGRRGLQRMYYRRFT